MPRNNEVTAREVSTFRSRCAKLTQAIDEAIALKTCDAKPRDTMLMLCITCTKLASAFDFGDVVRSKIQPKLMLMHMKANTPLAVRDTIQEAIKVLTEMKAFLAERIARLERELNE